jgi:hypothetical protein
LHLKLYPNKSTNNKDGKNKGENGGGNNFQCKDKVTSKVLNKTNDQGQNNMFGLRN